VYYANSDLLVFSLHVEKQSPRNSPNPTLELLFANQIARKSIKRLLFLASSASDTKQQKRNRGAFNRPWLCSFWPNATANQQSCSTSLSIKKMMANSPYNFITVECYLVAYLSNWVKIVPPHQHGHVDHCKCTIQHVCPFSVQSKPLKTEFITYINLPPPTRSSRSASSAPALIM
jgi:hypothetical protein